MPIADLIAGAIRERGPLTVAAFMELALYDPRCGYYARAARRSGRAGDFFTSVDVGPLFGELLELQIAEMARLLAPTGKATAENAKTAAAFSRDFSADSARSAVAFSQRAPFDLVEVGAGNGRLSADILKAARQHHPSFYDAVRLHLIEVSESARAAQHDALAGVSDRLASSRADLPETFEGVLIANELLDALPTHQVVMRDEGLREVYVSASGDALRTVEGPPSTAELQAYLDRQGVTLEPGWRVEVNLCALAWIRDAARRLTRGFMILIDYGHEARELYSATHSAGTLTSFAGHRSSAAESDSAAPAWLQRPCEQDITAHVDFTSVRAAAEAEGMTTLGFLDQTYFLIGLVEHLRSPQSTIDPESTIRNPQFKTLILPGGLGSTMKVLILGKGVGRPALAGCSFKVRVT